MNPVPANVDRYAVMGYPVQHSWSPFIHGMFAKQTGQTLQYTRIEVPPEGLANAIQRFFAEGGKGLNITVPHKQAAAALVRYRTPRASIAGAVNTIALQEGELLGDNTDGAGLLTDLTKNLQVQVAGARILLLGAGGAARGVLGPLLTAGPAYLEVANRNVERAVTLVEEYEALGEVHACGYENISREPFDLIINATSASLQGKDLPVPREAVTRRTVCYDMAYGKGDTAFTRWAKKIGAGRAETGWGMLVEQAAEAFELWRGVRPDTAPVLKALTSPPPPVKPAINSDR
jgi:shikimate dehydrogenase